MNNREAPLNKPIQTPNPAHVQENQMTATTQQENEIKAQQIIDKYIDLFFNRDDAYYIPRKRNGEFRGQAVRNTDHDWVPIGEALRNHIFRFNKENLVYIGANTRDKDGYLKWACIDLDSPVNHPNPGSHCNKPIPEAVQLIKDSLPKGYIPHVTKSKSGHGSHIWFFFEEKVHASRVIEDLKHYVKEHCVELYPKNSKSLGLDKKGLPELGNQVWLPQYIDFAVPHLGELFLDVNHIEYSKLPYREPKAVAPPKVTPRLPEQKNPSQGVVANVRVSKTHEEEGSRFTVVPDSMKASPKQGCIYTEKEILTAMPHLDLMMGYDEWIKVMAAIKSSGFANAEQIFVDWSSQSTKWDPSNFQYKWDSFDEGGGEYDVSMGSLIAMAKEGGWVPPKRKVVELTQAEIKYENEKLASQNLSEGELPEPKTDADADIAVALVEWYQDSGGFEFWDGRMWKYNADTGVWVKQKKSWYLTAVMQYNHMWVPNKLGKNTKITYSSAKKSGVTSIFKEFVCDPDSEKPEGVPGASFRNGFVGPDGLVPHSKEHYTTLYFDADFDPELDCPMMDNFLKTCFAGTSDCEERILCLQQLVGNALFGTPSKQARALFCWGKSRTGKSVFIETIANLFSADSRSAVDAIKVGDKRSNELLVNSKVNFQTEVSPKEIYKAATYLKRAICGESLEAAYMREMPFNFKPNAFFMFGSNFEISSGGGEYDAGLINKFVLIEFPNVVPREKMDTDLIKKIVGDGQRLISWAYQGFLKLKEANFIISLPPSHFGTEEEWNEEADPISRFIQDCVDISIIGKPKTEWPLNKDVYIKYLGWVQANGEERLTQIKVTRELKKHGFKVANRNIGRCMDISFHLFS